VKHLLNICNINGAEVEPVDIITFGSPCQDMSVAGKREGMKHSEQGDEETTRSGLFYEAIRIIKEMRESTNGEYPKYAVWENVPGAFSSNKGRDFHAVLEALCSVCEDAVSIPEPYDKKRTKLVWSKAGEIVGDNYSIAWRTLDAQYWGVPQRRKRIYLVADFTGRRAGEILFKPESLRGNMQKGNEAGQGVAADAVGGVDGSVGVECLNPWDCQSKRVYNPDGIYCTLPAMDCGGANNQAVIFSFDSLSSNSMKSSNPFSGCRAVEIAKCIDTTYPDPSKNQGGIAIVQECLGYDMYNQASTGDKTRTLKTPAGGDDLPVVCLQANGIDPAVCFDRATFNQGINAQYDFEVSQEGIVSTVVARGPSGVCYDARGNGDGETACTITGDHQNRITDYTAVAVQETYAMQRSDEYQECNVASTQSARQYKSATDLVVEKKRKYIIRRLTPTECARLQGFPDWWGHLAPYDPVDAEFWEDVRKTHAEINGKKYKPVKDIKKWYDKLHTDSAEYKMWGNGIALPNAEYVIRGIAEQGAKTLGSLFDGSGGFPLAGMLNGIMPVWASEVEPFPIAVTRYHFKEEHNGRLAR
jgi:DNA (cytosine-5)-methyltransferase 1